MRIKKVTISGLSEEDKISILGPIIDDKNVLLFGNDPQSIWIKAILFVLSHTNDVETLPIEFRNFTGYVEIIFEQSIDNQLETVKKEFSLKRSVKNGGSSFFHDNQLIDRIDMKNFLLHEGFSRKSPFQYFILRSDVHQAANSDAMLRFSWLEDCCGVNEFKEAHRKFVRELHDAKDLMEKIDSRLKKIEVQLNIFASNENQMIYQELVKRENALSERQRTFRIDQLKAEIAKLKSNKTVLMTTNAKIADDVVKYNKEVSELRKEVRKKSAEINDHTKHQGKFQHDVDVLEKEEESVKQAIEDLRNRLACDRLSETYSEHEKQLLNLGIEQHEHKLREVEAELDGLNLIDYGIEQNIAEISTDRDQIVLNSEQNRRLDSQFMSIADRDEALSSNLTEIENAIKRENRHIARINGQIERETAEVDALKKKHTDEVANLEKLNPANGNVNLKEMISVLETELSDREVMNTETVKKLHLLEADLDQISADIRTCVGDSMFDGLKSMDTFMQSKCPNELKSSCFGRVIENFTCSSPALYETLSTAGCFLFYYIVDKPETVTRIMALFDRQNLPGEVHFFALSVLDDSFDNEILPHDIAFDVKFRKVFNMIFGEESIDKESHGLLSSDESDKCPLNCIELFHRYTKTLDHITATKHDIRENKYLNEAVNARLAETIEQFNERQLKMGDIQNIQSTIKTLELQISGAEAKIQSKTALLEKHTQELAKWTELNIRYEQELQMPFLSNEDQAAVNSFDEVIAERTAQRQEMREVIAEVEVRHNTLKEFLDNNLKSRRNDLEERSMTFSVHASELDRQQRFLDRLKLAIPGAQKKLDEVTAKINDLLTEHDEVKRKITELNELKRVGQEKRQDIAHELQMMQIQENNFTIRLNQYCQQLRSVEVVSAAPLLSQDSGISMLTEKEVSNELKMTQHQMRTFEETNGYDLDLLDKFKASKAELHRRRIEMLKDEKRILDAKRKSEFDAADVIRTMFYDLSIQFENKFQKIVPNGAARMKLIKVNNNTEGNDVDDVGYNFDGLELFAAFQSEEKSLENMTSDEKMVTALAFILSIQQLFMQAPMPFYLFDSIDECVPESYRESLVQLLMFSAIQTQIFMASNYHEWFKAFDYGDNVFRCDFAEGSWHTKRIPLEAAVRLSRGDNQMEEEEESHEMELMDVDDEPMFF